MIDFTPNKDTPIMIPPSVAQAQALEVLAQSPDYRILTRVPTTGLVVYREPQGRTFRGVFVDTETTGLTDTDKVIEIGVVSFDYDAHGITQIVDAFNEQEDPGVPLRQEIVALTGLTNGYLDGKTFNRERIQSAFSEARLLLAHNAFFDRRMLERVFPIAAEKPWACSQTQVPWADVGMGSTRLEYLVMRSGFFYDAHRAETDCRAAVHLLAQPYNPEDGDSRQTFTVLREAAIKTGLHVWLIDLPFDKKDEAKAAGCVWSDGNTPGNPKA